MCSPTNQILADQARRQAEKGARQAKTEKRHPIGWVEPGVYGSVEKRPTSTHVVDLMEELAKRLGT